MPYANFVHLRVHSAYSLLEGAIKLKTLVGLCAENAMPAVAVTDTGSLFGAMEFSLAAADAGVQPIIGTLLGLAREDEAERGAALGHRAAPDRLPLLAQNEAGYCNLMALSSKAFLETEAGDPAQLDLGALESRSEGLIALTGGLDGPLGRLLAEGQDAAAQALLERLQRLFPERLYVELQRHGLEAERRIEARLIELADERGLPLVATNDVYFADAAMFEAHDALLCVAGSTYVGESQRRRLTPEHRFKSAGEMRALFEDLPEALDNTLVIARRCAFKVPVVKPILPAYPAAAGRSEAEELRAQAIAGLERRLETAVYRPGEDAAQRTARAAPYRERLDYELGVIIEMQYPGYFLIVADFIGWAKSHGIPVGPGRGSGAGSAVAWALGITDLDPLRFGLLFERFLNPERVSMPDFDIDFCQDRRDEVIAYVCEKYGIERVAQIITFGKLQARAVLRDVGRVLQIPYPVVDRICKKVPYNPAHPVSLQEAIDADPSFGEMRDSDPQIARLLDISLKLEGLYRHASTHAAGVVIGNRPLIDLIPLYRDPRSPLPATQFSMKYVELAGLVKFDFLGLKTLTVIDRAVKLLAAQGVVLDLAALPLDDAATFTMLGRGETSGVFQLESAGMRDALRQLKPDCFEDIIAMVALYRPGPMGNIPRFIACKHGTEQPDYLDERLEDLLRETRGVIVYQEQVMEIARRVAGYSLGSADLLRRAMGKKIKSEMDAQREIFVKGAIERGLSDTKAVHLFDLVARFADYGFNKSHAAAYALVAYQTAYLKAHYPVEFFAASMTLDLQNTDKLNLFRQELDRLGIDLLPPDINHSTQEFSVERSEEGRKAIRYALAAVRNVGMAAVSEIVAERTAKGPFAGLADLCARAEPRVLNKRLLEGLVKAGAFDALDFNRARLFDGIETLLRYGAATAAERHSQQVNLFGAGDEGRPPPPALPARPDWAPMERLDRERDAIGFYLSAHPIDAYEDYLEGLGVKPAANLGDLVSQGVSSVKLAGVVLAKQERMGQQGRFAFVRLSDPSSTFEVAVFREVYAQAADLLAAGRPVLVSASARLDGEMVKLTASAVQDLEQATLRRGSDLVVSLGEAEPARREALERLKAILGAEGEGRSQIRLLLRLGDGREVEIGLSGRYRLSPAARAEIRALDGVAGIADARG